MVVQLLELRDGRFVRRFELRDATYRLGRDPGNDLCFRSPRVSRFHAELRREDDGYRLVDRGSANHVRVNGERVVERLLRSGDVVELADAVTLLYLDGADQRRQWDQEHLFRMFGDLMRTLPLGDLVGREGEGLAHIEEVAQHITGAAQLRTVLGRVLDAVMEIFEAERGFIALVEDGELRFDEGVARNVDPGRVGDAADAEFSRSIMERALETRQIQVVDRTLGGGAASQSFLALRLQRAISSPLMVRGRVVGVIYVDTRSEGEPLGDAGLRLVRILIDQAAIAVENSRLYLGLWEEKRVQEGQCREQARRLEESEEMFRILTEHSDQGIFIAREGRIVYANAACTRLLEPVGDDLLRLLDRVEERHRAALQVAIGLGGDPEPVRVPIELPDETAGRMRYLEIRSQPLRYGGGRARQGFVIDVTEQKLLQEQLLLAQRMEAMGRLASGVAHDFNNLLTIIRSGAELLADTVTGREEREILADIAAATSRGIELTDRLRLAGRRRRARREPVDLNGAVHEVVALLGRTLPKRIRTEVDLPVDPPVVRIDPGQLSQTLLNLGVNARDAMPDGGVLRFEIRVGPLDRDVRARFPWLAPGAYATLRVSDTGVGMDEATRQRIFEPFFTTKGPHRGTGLGLSTAWAVVRESGGAIDVTSRPGQGTTFAVHLPLTDDTPVGRHEPAAPAVRLDRLRILLVDDEGPVRRQVRRVLAGRGHEVESAASGPEALERLAAGPRPDIVLLDAAMPEMSGFETFRRLRARHPDLPVLMLSGAPEMADQGPPPPSGWPPLLMKPFDTSTLLRAIQGALGPSGADGADAEPETPAPRAASAGGAAE